MINLSKDHKTIPPVFIVASACAGLLTLAIFSSPLHAAPASRYVVHADEVYDKDKDLTWQRCSVGQNWKDGKGCEGAIKTFTFQGAQSQAKDKWRIPTKDELASLVDNSHTDFPTTDRDAFPGMNEDIPGYWSSTASSSGRSWDVRFTSGEATDDINARQFAVRLVRSGK
jgi:hypothetical protein